VPQLSSLCTVLNAELHPAGLPVWQAREDFVAMINGHQTTILVGETGSGKTTQIAQFIAEAGYCSSRKLIACTQVLVAPCKLVPTGEGLLSDAHAACNAMIWQNMSRVRHT